MSSMSLSAAIQNRLEETFHLPNWSISRPDSGQQKECYIARTGAFAVFLKFDESTSIAVLQRLGELGVAPAVLGTGSLDGKRYILQEYLPGKHPEWQWFAHHPVLLAQIARRYHADVQLKQLLTNSTLMNYHEQIALELASLETQIASLQENPHYSMSLNNVFADLKSQANQLHPIPLTPVHNDPNGANILLIDETMVLVDWDDILLSDPMRDIGQWLGWYVPQNLWPLFFREYGLPLDQSLVTRVYWWSARASFANVLWHIEHGYNYEVFLNDSIAALDQTITPHQVFHEDI